MTIRSLSFYIIVVAPAVLLLALGPRGNVEAPNDRTIVQYWEKWAGVEGAAMKAVVDQFNTTVGKDEGIWVEYHAMSNVDQRMLIATAGGDPPDVAGLYDYVIPQFADRDALLPLDDLCRDYGIDLDAFKPIWLRIGRYEDRLFALPSTPYTIALFYNRELFRQAGLDPDKPPQTIAELDACAVRLTERNPETKKIDQLGFTVSPAMLGWWHWIWPIYFDAELWDGHHFEISSPKAVAAYEWIHHQRVMMGSVGRNPAEVTEKGANADVLIFEGTAGAIEGAQNPFLSGRLAMVFQGPWMTNWIQTYAPSLDYGVAPFPSVSQDRPHHFASTDVFVIPRGASHVREAMIFLQYVMRQDVLEGLCLEHGKISPFRKPRPEFYALHKNPYIRVFDDMAASDSAFGYPAMPMWAQTWTETLRMLETILRGLEEPGAVLIETQARMDAIVSEYQSMQQRRREGEESS